MTEHVKPENIHPIAVDEAAARASRVAARAQRIAALGRGAQVLWEQLRSELVETPIGQGEGPCGFRACAGIGALIAVIVDLADQVEDELL